MEAFRDRLEPDPAPTEVGRLAAEGRQPRGSRAHRRGDRAGHRDPGGDRRRYVRHGSVVIAAITSCTNTSNPSVMLAAGLLAKQAVEAGLETRAWVKTSLAPGSRVVTDYLDRAGLTPYLEKLGFALVGYGCTTCIGNSGPLPDEVAAAVDEGGPQRRRRAVGQPELRGADAPAGARVATWRRRRSCVAYALAGRSTSTSRPSRSARAPTGRCTSRDLWPDARRGREAAIRDAITRRAVRDASTARIWEGDERWRALPTPDRARVRVGSGLDLRPGAAVLRRPAATRRSRRHRGRARPREGRRLDHHRPHLARPDRSRPTHRPGVTSRSAASSPATSTPTGLAVATTR